MRFTCSLNAAFVYDCVCYQPMEQPRITVYLNVHLNSFDSPLALCLQQNTDALYDHLHVFYMFFLTIPSSPAGQPLWVALFCARAARLGLRWWRLPRPDCAAARVPHEAPQHHPADGKETDSRPPQPSLMSPFPVSLGSRPANLCIGAERRGVRRDDQRAKEGTACHRTRSYSWSERHKVTVVTWKPQLSLRCHTPSLLVQWKYSFLLLPFTNYWHFKHEYIYSFIVNIDSTWHFFCVVLSFSNHCIATVFQRSLFLRWCWSVMSSCVIPSVITSVILLDVRLIAALRLSSFCSCVACLAKREIWSGEEDLSEHLWSPSRNLAALLEQWVSSDSHLHGFLRRPASTIIRWDWKSVRDNLLHAWIAKDSNP